MVDGGGNYGEQDNRLLSEQGTNWSRGGGGGGGGLEEGRGSGCIHLPT